MTVDEILADVLAREGGYVEHPNDRGGPTNLGITMRTLEAWRGRRCTRAELKRLTRDEALQIYRRLYVEQNGIQRFDGHPIQAQLVDSAVLSGPVAAVKDLQQVLGVTVDGIAGDVTYGAAVGMPTDVLGRRLAVERTMRLVSIVARDRQRFRATLKASLETASVAAVERVVTQDQDQSAFLRGWVTRSLSFIA